MQLLIALLVVAALFYLGYVFGRQRGWQDVYGWQAEAAKDLRFRACVRRHALWQDIDAASQPATRRQIASLQLPRIVVLPLIEPTPSRWGAN